MGLEYRSLLEIKFAGAVLGGVKLTAADNIHIWDGFGSLDIVKPGETSTTKYLGLGYALQTGPVESRAGVAGERTQVSIVIGKDNAKAQEILSQDYGPRPVILRFIGNEAPPLPSSPSTPQTGDWKWLPITKRGRLSSPQFDEDGVLRLEIESLWTHLARRKPTYYTHASQQAEHANDNGLIFLAELQRGFSSSWPFGFKTHPPLSRPGDPSQETQQQETPTGGFGPFGSIGIGR